MKRKLTSIIVLCALLICCNAMPLLAHAEENSLLRDTSFVADIDNDAMSVIYVGDLPRLLTRSIKLTSNSLNPGSIVIRVISYDATILLDNYDLLPGRSVTFSVPAELDGGEFTILAMANAVSGAYSFSINQGDGPNLITTNLTTNSWTRLSSSSVPLFFNRTVTITNHIDSSGPIRVRIIGDSGEALVNFASVAPGQSVSTTISSDLFSSSSYVIQAQALNINGLYFITIDD